MPFGNATSSLDPGDHAPAPPAPRKTERPPLWRPRHVAIVREIVAGHHREGRQAGQRGGCASAFSDDLTEGRASAHRAVLRRRRSIDGMRPRSKTPVRGIDEVAALGHGERRRCGRDGCGQARDQRNAAIGRLGTKSTIGAVQRDAVGAASADCSTTLQSHGPAPPEPSRIAAVRRASRRRRRSPSPEIASFGGTMPIEIDRLMGAMKIADADMDARPAESDARIIARRRRRCRRKRRREFARVRASTAMPRRLVVWCLVRRGSAQDVAAVDAQSLRQRHSPTPVAREKKRHRRSDPRRAPIRPKGTASPTSRFFSPSGRFSYFANSANRHDPNDRRRPRLARWR